MRHFPCPLEESAWIDMKDTHFFQVVPFKSLLAREVAPSIPKYFINLFVCLCLAHFPNGYPYFIRAYCDTSLLIWLLCNSKKISGPNMVTRAHPLAIQSIHPLTLISAWPGTDIGCTSLCLPSLFSVYRHSKASLDVSICAFMVTMTAELSEYMQTSPPVHWLLRYSKAHEEIAKTSERNMERWYTSKMAFWNVGDAEVCLGSSLLVFASHSTIMLELHRLA